MSIEPIRELIAALAGSASALAVLGGELQARVSGKQLPPSVRPHVEAILKELGASSPLEGGTPEELRTLVTEIRHFWLLDGEFLANPERTPGWTYTNPEVLSTGGELTEGFADVLPRIAPQFDDLAARLGGRDGRFLDVGTGAGRLSIAMARRWPALHVVGIDIWAPSLAAARTNVEAAGLGDRIELREPSGAELLDEQVFDLAWLPAPFMPPQVLWRTVERVHQALKPGGWLLFATAKPGTDLRSAI